jgi:hypothetical protein
VPEGNIIKSNRLLPKFHDSEGFSLTKNEHIIDETSVKVWKLQYLSIPILSFLILILLSYFYWEFTAFRVIVIFLIPLILIYSRHSIRQHWDLTLTNERIVAKRIVPPMLNHWFMRIHHFPIKNIEGLSVGPRAYVTVFIIGLFIFTNLGINMLKNALSVQGTDEYDPPDFIEFFIVFFQGSGIGFIENWGHAIEDGFIQAVDFVQIEVQITFSIIFSIIGILIILYTFPRRQYMGIRIRNGPDFSLRGGFPRRFWESCYKQLYNSELQLPQSGYEKLNFPWLRGERVEETVDLQQTIYFNRYLGLFAIIFGSTRIIEIFDDPSRLTNQIVILLIIVALLDLLIAILAFKYSRKMNEMFITNKRILFSTEERHLSGAVAKRMYFVSDVKLQDISGFEFDRIRGFSIWYLIISVILIIIGIVAIIELFSISVLIIFALALVTLSFVNQTHVGFILKTKGGEMWRMRHQLVNPLTRIRQVLGEESVFVRVFFLNRLEEREVVRAVHHIRSKSLNMRSKIVDQEFFKKRRIHVTVKDLLFPNEKVIFAQSIPRSIPKRNRVILIACIVFLINTIVGWGYLLAFNTTDLIENELLSIVIYWAVMLFCLFQLFIIYFSLRKIILYVTPQRVFIEDKTDPPAFLYFSGIYRKSIISETLREQVHSTFTKKQTDQASALTKFVILGLIGSIMMIISGLIVAALLNEVPLLFLTPIQMIFIAMSFVLISSILFFIATVELAKALPKRILITKGIGVHFTIPYLSTKRYSRLSLALWDTHILVEDDN